jgi:thymidylate kinase
MIDIQTKLSNEALGISKAFFETSKKRGIALCHWKSNLHLNDALAGKTDLDLMVHVDDCSKFKRVIADLDFKEMISPPEKRYPGIEDYLGFDYETGNLIHLHVHFKLIMGQKKVKNHHLPLEQYVLNNLHEINGVPVPRAEIELLFLCLRANLKTSVKDVWRVRLRKRSMIYPSAIIEEFNFLLVNANSNKFRRAIQKSGLLLDEALFVEFSDALRNDCLTFKLSLKMRTHVFKSLKKYRRYSAPVCFLRVALTMFKALRVVQCFFKQKRKKLSKKGKVFAFIGADGSGKSTLTAEIAFWLSWKLSVRLRYLGKQRTSSIMLMMHLSTFINKFKRTSFGKVINKSVKNIYNLATAIMWLLVAKKRLRIHRKVCKLAERSYTVIVDRYPLIQLHNMDYPMDGPRIRAECGLKWMSLLVKEESTYSLIELPNKIFVLRTPVEVLLERKGSPRPDLISQKAEAINAIKESEVFSVIDGNRKYSDVLIDIKRKIWKRL